MRAFLPRPLKMLWPRFHSCFYRLALWVPLFLLSQPSLADISCPSPSDIEPESLRNLINALSHRLPAAGTKPFERFCLYSPHEDARIARIAFSPEPLAVDATISPEISCTTTVPDRNWDCEPVRWHRQLADGGDSIDLAADVSLELAREAVRSVRMLTPEGVERLSVKGWEESMNFGELSRVRRIWIKDEHVFVAVGLEDFYGFNLRLERVRCGLPKCAFQLVEIQFWLS